MQDVSSAAEVSPTINNEQDLVKQKLRKLQKTKNYKALGQAGGLSVVQTHCGWGWRGIDDVGSADDLPYEAEAWEAGCFESGLMNDVDEMPSELSEEMLAFLGLTPLSD